MIITFPLKACAGALVPLLLCPQMWRQPFLPEKHSQPTQNLDDIHIVVRIHINGVEFTVILFLFFTIGSMPLGAQACCPATLWDHHKSRAQTKVEEEAEWQRTACLHFQGSAFLEDVRLRALATKWQALAGQRTCSPPRRPTQESAMLPVFHSPLEVPTKSPENILVIKKSVSGAKKLHPGKFCIFTLDKSFLRN